MKRHLLLGFTTMLAIFWSMAANRVCAQQTEAIYFTSNRDGNEEIYRMNIDGSNVRRITNTSWQEVLPRISPDGSKILFASNQSGFMRHYIMNLDGSNVRALPSYDQYDSENSHCWSPDGQKIVFSTQIEYSPSSWSPSTVRMFTLDWNDLSNSQMQILFGYHGTPSESQEFFWTDWSPDGSKLAYHRGHMPSNDGNADVYLYNFADGTHMPLTADNAGNTRPAWSPDGSKIVFTKQPSIYLMNADGTAPIFLATGNFPRWSPDGGKILFSSNQTGRWHLYVMNADGSGVAQLTQGSHDNLLADWKVISDFSEVNSALIPTYASAAAWGDYDNDSDLDILYTGNAAQFNPHTPTVNPVSKIYRNDGGNFQDVAASLAPLWSGEVAWGDYDNDGDLDILMTGLDASSMPTSKVYRNDAGTFNDIGAALTGVYQGAAAWGDYDNDGDLDILLSGTAFNGSYLRVARVYRNDGGSFVDINASLTGVDISSGAWGDYDNDGDLDLLLAGNLGGAQFKSAIYRNDSGTFNEIDAGLTGVWGASVAWGDYDNDGDLDILLSGNSQLHYPGALISKVYRNDGGSFQDVSAGLLGLYGGSAAWGDYDNDGDLDILLTGETRDSNGPDPYTKVYRNDNGSFQDISASLIGVAQSTGVWGDYDNDGDLDFLIAGENRFTPMVKIYRNETGMANTSPAAPTGLFTVVTNDTVFFGWNKPDDAQTAQEGLTYNLRVGKTPGGVERIPPMADLNSGYRKIVRLGNTNHKNVWMLTNVEDGIYYWSVQAIDHAFAGSPFAEEQTFSVCNHPPVVDAGADKEICIGEVVSLGGNPTATGSAPPFTFNWSPAEGLDDPASANPLAAPTETMTYTLEVIDANGCKSTDEITITVHSFVLAANDLVRLVRNKNSSGDIHSNGDIEFSKGAPGTHAGNLAAVNNISIRDKNTITGDVTAGGNIIIARGAVVNGVTTSHANVPTIPMPSLDFGAGGENKVVPRNRSVALAPGSYGSVTVNENGILSLSAGSYFLSMLETKASAVLSVDASTGPVRINVVSKMAFGAKTKVEIIGAATDHVTFSTLQGTEVSIAKQSLVQGALLAPNAPVHFLANCRFTGSICAKAVTFEANVIFQSHSSPGAASSVAELPQEVTDEETTEDVGLPLEYELLQNYPNPFNPSTTIAYKLPEDAKVTLQVFGINGQLVRTLVNSEKGSGFQNATWDGRDESGRTVATGVYFYVIEARPNSGGQAFKQTRQMLFIK